MDSQQQPRSIPLEVHESREPKALALTTVIDVGDLPEAAMGVSAQDTSPHARRPSTGPRPASPPQFERTIERIADRAHHTLERITSSPVGPGVRKQEVPRGMFSPLVGSMDNQA